LHFAFSLISEKIIKRLKILYYWDLCRSTWYLSRISNWLPRLIHWTIYFKTGF